MFLQQPDGNGKYFGRYRARVEARVDPEQLYRVRVRVHGLHPEATPVNKLPWAQPNKDVGDKWGAMGVPPLKTDVWVTFLEGDHEYPVYGGAAFGDKTIIDGKDANKHKYWPTNAYGKKRTKGVLKSESDASGDKAPDVFGYLSPLQKRLELDDRLERERVLLADAYDNFLWINSERGVITLEAVAGEQTKDGPMQARGITFSSDPDYQAIQLYTFKNWQITVDDKTGACEIASPLGHLFRINDGESSSIEAWTKNGKRLILDDGTNKIAVQTPDGYGVSINEAEQRVFMFTKDGDQSVLLDRKNKKLRMFSVEDIEIASKKNLLFEAEQDIIINPKRLLHLDKKKGDVTVTKDEGLNESEISTASKPERLQKVKRACDYPFYED